MPGRPNGHEHLTRMLVPYLGFVVLQLATGVILYFGRIGTTPAEMLEYYMGSAEMLRLFPDATDNFRPARSFTGILELTLGHFLAYGTTVFVVGHLWRSVRPPSPRTERFLLYLYLVAGLEIASGFLFVSIYTLLGQLAPGAVLFILFGLRSGAFLAYILGLGLLLVRLLIEVFARTSFHRAAAASLVLMAIPMAIGCLAPSSRYRVEELNTPEHRVSRTTGNYLGGSHVVPGQLALWNAELNLQRSSWPDAEDVFSIHLRHMALDPIAIPPGETLRLVLNGETELTFDGRGTAEQIRVFEETEYGIVYVEQAYWHEISGEELERIAEAETIRVYIDGDAPVRYYFTDANIENWRRFLREQAERP